MLGLFGRRRSSNGSGGAPDGILVRAERLGKQYGHGEVAVHALQDVDLALPGGELTVFVGPSGSGKTTLLNIVGGLDRPTAGSIVVEGLDLGALDERALTRYRRRQVGFVFQFFNLVPTLTARENVELVAELAEAPADVGDVLESVGLADRAEHFPAALSGGEQQRVALARALVKQPALILADEPTGSLDYETGIRVLDTMRRVTRERGNTVFLVTHNSEITRMADRVIHLRSGRVAEVQVNSSPVPPSELRW
ncbi:MAG TPA: ABC transporter ATP-binding protein [Chthonomonadales bacterium]|nr:ABC transporter ATP-binding protein [Chthonomonadales bacterium]